MCGISMMSHKNSFNSSNDSMMNETSPGFVKQTMNKVSSSKQYTHTQYSGGCDMYN